MGLGFKKTAQNLDSFRERFLEWKRRNNLTIKKILAENQSYVKGETRKMALGSEVAPLISVIVIAYDMPIQALNTLYSLSHIHQREVDQSIYEVVIVENRSKNLIPQSELNNLPGNFHYYLRDETGVSPAPAINFALSVARGRYIGLMIDGARMVTPGVIHNVLLATRLSEEPLVVVPGYHLGDVEHQLQDSASYSVSIEQEMLANLDWKRDGYELFCKCCLSGANRHGFFHPFMECNCIFASKNLFMDIGGANEKFDLGGGGSLNLYLYFKLAMHPETTLFVLPGEGSFHQVHGGITTTNIEDREDVLRAHRNQLNSILGHSFYSPKIEPTFLGKIPPQALPWMEFSIQRGIERVKNFARQGRDLFDDDKARKHPQHLYGTD